MPLKKQLIDLLACPDCQVKIKYSKRGRKESLKCPKCKRSFEITNGIPNMLPKDFQ